MSFSLWRPKRWSPFISLETTDTWMKVIQHLRKLFFVWQRSLGVIPRGTCWRKRGSREESSRLVSTPVRKRPQVYRQPLDPGRSTLQWNLYSRAPCTGQARLHPTPSFLGSFLPSLTSLPRRFLLRASPQYIMCIWIFVSSSASRELQTSSLCQAPR